MKITIDKIYADAGDCITIWKSLFPNAAKVLSHYLENTGADYKLDVKYAIKNSSEVKKLYNKNVEYLKEHTKSVLRDGDKIYIITKSMTTHDYGNFPGVVFDMDWVAVLGKSSGGIVAVAERVGEDINIRYRYIIYDYYDWDPTRDLALFPFLPKDSSMYKLHHAGLAGHFKIYGEQEYEIKMEAHYEK